VLMWILLGRADKLNVFINGQMAMTQPVSNDLQMQYDKVRSCVVLLCTRCFKRAVRISRCAEEAGDPLDHVRCWRCVRVAL
jgi:hypothetical protein